MARQGVGRRGIASRRRACDGGPQGSRLDRSLPPPGIGAAAAPPTPAGNGRILEVTALCYHVLAMAVGQCLTAFFAVWTVHHGCDRHRFIARTVRGRLKNFVSFNMFFHVEHHLYPRMPTCHLARLAERLDVAVPELQQRRVF